MGKILISNCNEYYDSLHTTFSQNGFDISFFEGMPCGNISFYHKRLIKADNVYKEGNRYVGYTGTLIYKGVSGQSASKLILEDWGFNSIKEIRKSCIGSFCLVIKDVDEVIVFVDETNTYRIYYWEEDSKFIITNTYYHIQKVIHSEVNRVRFHEFTVRKSIMGAESPVCGVKKLLAEQVIHIKSNHCFLIEATELNDYSCKYLTLDEAITDIAERITLINENRIRNFTKYLHFITGGIDSRLELALLSDERCHVKTGYWTGNDPITNGSAEDLRIASELSEKQNRQFTHYIVDEDFSEACQFIEEGRADIFGEYSAIYSGNSKWFSIFEELRDVEYVNFGYFGEILRPLAELDDVYKKGYDLESLVNDIYCRSGINRYLFREPELKSQIIEEYRKINKKVGYSDILTKTNAFNLFSFSRFEADCIINNFINMFTYGFPVFSQKRLADAIFSIPYEMRCGEVIPLRLIELFDDRLLDVDFYSHHQKAKYDKKRKIISGTLNSRIKKMIKQLIVNTPLYKSIYIKYLRMYVHPNEDKSKAIVRYCEEYVSNMKIITDDYIKLCDSKLWMNLSGACIGDYFSLLLLINCLYSCALKGAKDV